jgi:hypothetical protein
LWAFPNPRPLGSYTNQRLIYPVKLVGWVGFLLSRIESF